MFVRTRPSERGDTLIEVLLAISILAFLVVGTAVIMNSGLSATQGALERTQVQASMQGQAAVLRALRDAAIADTSLVADQAWSNLTTNAATPNPVAQKAVCTVGGYSGVRFSFDDTTNDVSTWLNPVVLGAITTEADAVPAADVLPIPGDGMWIEVYSGGSAVPYYDFYIKACWENNATGPKQELKTVVRLYGE